MQQRKKNNHHIKAFSVCCFSCLIEISHVLPTSKLIRFLHFGAFDLISPERFGDLVAGPGTVTATRGQLRAGMDQQGCAELHCLQASLTSASALRCFLFMVTLINRDSTGIASNALN